MKSRSDTSIWSSLEGGCLELEDSAICRVRICDSRQWVYCDENPRDGRVEFQARGSAGWHRLSLFDAEGRERGDTTFRVQARTRISCGGHPYEHLFRVLERDLKYQREIFERDPSGKPYLWIPEIDGKLYPVFVTWSRDHAFTLKAMKYFSDRVREGTELWLETQQENGMFWDCFHPNSDDAPNWIGEALGEGWSTYYEGFKLVARRIPVEADVEYCIAEAVYHGWKATGDDAWMIRQLPRLEAALRYTTSDPLRWSSRHQLVKRSFTADSWDFANPHFCNGDHRCINPGDPAFLFHGDNSGLYQFYCQLSEMHAAAGNTQRATELKEAAEALRKRANAKLFGDTHYAHMVPDELDPAEVHAKVGDERRRISLSTGYTINRGLPGHEQAVSILREYMRRREANRENSFAEWWTMDPPYEPAQWPDDGYGRAGVGLPYGEYMNGALCHIVSGELAVAAFTHGMEDYGVDILNRVCARLVQDDGEIFQAYRRLPEGWKPAWGKLTPLDMRSVVNRGLRHGATAGVKAWTDEGENDMRNLPVGTLNTELASFEIIDPASNNGLSVLCVEGNDAPVRIQVPEGRCGSLVFLHAISSGARHAMPVATYLIKYADGTAIPIPVRAGIEIANWWDARNSLLEIVDGQRFLPAARVAWRGSNPLWKNVGLYAMPWNNPAPEKRIESVEIQRSPFCAGTSLLVAAITASDLPAPRREAQSYGIPAVWSCASLLTALVEGLAGVKDLDTGFAGRVEVSPRWTATGCERAEVCVHYPASGGYVAYTIEWQRAENQLFFDLTGSFETARVRLLLPQGTMAAGVTCAGHQWATQVTQIEASNYLEFALEELPKAPLEVLLAPERAQAV